MSDLNLPNFLVIGAQKAGTTWLSAMLSQHPDIGVAVSKEVHFFDHPDRFSRGIEWYAQQFPRGRQPLRGEFTPNYLWTFGCSREVGHGGLPLPLNIVESLDASQLKLICLLRNPVDRAVSAYYHHVRKGRVSVRTSILDVADQWGIESMGRYDEHLEAWLCHVRRNQLLVLIYEQALRDDCKRQTLERVCDHLGASRYADWEGLHDQQNEAGSHFRLHFSKGPLKILGRNRVAKRLPRRLTEHPRWRLEISPAARQELARRFQPHVERLETMLDMDLSIWKEADGRLSSTTRKPTTGELPQGD
ncbi:MAG: sulfotransferase domain-containing protein [Pseudomonadota bacterium]|nr:sulfotransferase domain-containing protein [Pseudomonadota bacterium]